jgi:pentatricopeptide repeat domain-containing protein 1
VECFGVMLRAGTPPSLASCNAVLTLCAARGYCELAFDVHRRMTNAGVCSDTTTFNQLVRLTLPSPLPHFVADRQIKSRHTFPWRRHAVTIAVAGERLDSLARLSPQCVVCLSPGEVDWQVSACDRANEWGRALEVLPAMQAAAVAPNIVTFSALLDVCVHADDWQAALAVHSAMPTAGTQVSCEPTRIVPFRASLRLHSWRPALSPALPAAGPPLRTPRLPPWCMRVFLLQQLSHRMFVSP